MVVQRRRRWADAVHMLYLCFVFAGSLPRPPHFQVGENYSNLSNLGPNMFKYLCLNTHLFPNNGGLTAIFF